MAEEEKKLYPMRFCSLVDTYSWGTDEFIVADLGYRDTLVKDGWLAANALSEVMDTYMDRVVGDTSFERYGRQFPVQVKHICCKGKMPLRVHPDDTVAEERYDALGKEKLWYVLKSSKNAKLYLGFKKTEDAASLLASLEDGSIENLMNTVSPKAGEFFHIAPGTIHGASGDIEIVEISESSALDFCIHSWGEVVSPDEFDESCTIVDALDFIDFGPYKSGDELPQFTVKKMDLRDPLHIINESNDSFAIYHCLYGEAMVRQKVEVLGDMDYRIKSGETILVPSEVEDFFLIPMAQTTSVLEIMVDNSPEKDPYINPNVPEKLPEEDE